MYDVAERLQVVPKMVTTLWRVWSTWRQKQPQRYYLSPTDVENDTEKITREDSRAWRQSHVRQVGSAETQKWQQRLPKQRANKYN